MKGCEIGFWSDIKDDDGVSRGKGKLRIVDEWQFRFVVLWFEFNIYIHDCCILAIEVRLSFVSWIYLHFMVLDAKNWIDVSIVKTSMIWTC